MEPLAHTTRGDGIESAHYGSIAVTDNAGKLLYYAGDPGTILRTNDGGGM